MKIPTPILLGDLESFAWTAGAASGADGTAGTGEEAVAMIFLFFLELRVDCSEEQNLVRERYYAQAGPSINIR
jgi:hypothetical protein